jgi:glycosyltransferase involved in cell wall biosynthesis
MTVEASIVIPTYNESLRLPSVLASMFDVLSQIKDNFEIIISDDDSPDDTINKLKNFVISIDCPINVNMIYINNGGRYGKGHAIHKGFECSLGKYVIIYDADGAIPSRYIPEALAYIQNNEIDALLGMRIVDQYDSKVRRIISLSSLLLAHMIVFKSPVNDSQCGFKILKSSLLRYFNNDFIIKSGMFDVELIHLLQRNKIKYSYYPVHWINDKDTRVGLRLGLIYNFLDLLKIRFHYGS